MKGEERRRTILQLAIVRGGVAVAEIVDRFGVSKMTAHRDLQQLEAAGLVSRIYGGAVPKSAGAGSLGSCCYCQRPVLGHQRYRLLFEDGSQCLACCPRCGFALQQERDGVAGAMVTDFISGRELKAAEAFFLMNSSATPCCRPSILAFASEAEVRAFHAGFGGGLGRLPDALEYLRVAMELQRNS